jgi:hypothetical protein
VPFTLPDPHPGLDWEVLIDTGEAGTGGRAGQGAKLTVPPKALVLLRAARA